MGHIDKDGIKLSPEHATIVEGAVDTGEFASPTAVVEEALREWQERRENFGYSKAELQRLVQDGIDSGPMRDGPSTMKRLIDKYEAMAEPR